VKQQNILQNNKTTLSVREQQYYVRQNVLKKIQNDLRLKWRPSILQRYVKLRSVVHYISLCLSHTLIGSKKAKNLFKKKSETWFDIC
jgi:hypothetical protein